MQTQDTIAAVHAAPKPPHADFTTCTMGDVIANSLALHPSLLAEELDRVSGTHAAAARTLLDSRARQAFEGMAHGAGIMATLTRRDMLLPVLHAGNLSRGRQTVLFSAACRLQCIPDATAQDIVLRSQARVRRMERIRRLLQAHVRKLS